MTATVLWVSTNRVRLLILIVAYNAESTLTPVLDRLPAGILRDYDCEVLVIDDASDDSTFEHALTYRRAHVDLPLTVLRNRSNQGYGGNQKVGYAYAIQEGFDFVALVHGDGQYAPEELPNLLAPLVAGTSDAVFGSRMLERGAARRGGMPLYKLLGNKLLSWAQNVLAGARLSEWHSGYRLYRVSTLASVRYASNSNDFGFDTEIILQLLHAGAHITERAIPTYYGDEICRVNGLRYAGQVMAASLGSALHRHGLVHQRRFQPIAVGNDHYALKLGFASSHSWALDAVPDGARVLDLGAGPGGLAYELARKGCPTAVIDIEPPTQLTPGVVTHVADLNEQLVVPIRDYDFYLMLDVIEHLKDPEAFLDGLRARLDDAPRTLIITTPNIAFIVPRLMLLFGQFNYGQTGILDRTHTRLFTFRTLRRLLRDSGFQIQVMKGIPAPIPKAIGDSRLSRALLGLNQALIHLSPGLFSYQIFVSATVTPDVTTVLASTRASIEASAA
jgi:glycosyltransferase involved in cell wall biosynthesis/2-polyprenyl-3-methyl-5-hydroxy-6-metoxy-1,4-benzoquinol methylase